MKVLAIIPARGGSKSLHKKNIYPLLGKPLIAYSIEAALASKKITRVVVSTDDEEIASVAREYSAEVPFMRPKNIAGDRTLDLPVFQHALRWLKKNENYSPDLVVHIWATAPYRRKSDFDKAIAMIQKDPKATCVRAVTYPLEPPFKMWRGDKGKYLTPLLLNEYRTLYEKYKKPHEMPRQALPKILFQSGYLSVIRPRVILEDNSMHGDKVLPFFHPPETYTDFDSAKDIHHTEWVIKKYYTKK
ncbi:MAG: acylneuraminate cytidylyltransferase family protein [Parcubacteria group bacterium]|nr:acylneuraminate cytidylyltransferase family protein [Parcubacteria group bacterium]